MKEYICDKCNGKGKIESYKYNNNRDSTKIKTCSKCRGTGKLDWLENIFGKNINEVDYWNYTFSTPSTFLTRPGESYNLQEEILNALSEQIAIDIDKDIMTSLLKFNERINSGEISK